MRVCRLDFLLFFLFWSDAVPIFFIGLGHDRRLYSAISFLYSRGQRDQLLAFLFLLLQSQDGL